VKGEKARRLLGNGARFAHTRLQENVDLALR
jgi:hypothetical protein